MSLLSVLHLQICSYLFSKRVKGCEHTVMTGCPVFARLNFSTVDAGTQQTYYYLVVGGLGFARWSCGGETLKCYLCYPGLVLELFF